jgi:hypothetical protein
LQFIIIIIIIIIIIFFFINDIYIFLFNVKCKRKRYKSRGRNSIVVLESMDLTMLLSPSGKTREVGCQLGQGCQNHGPWPKSTCLLALPDLLRESAAEGVTCASGGTVTGSPLKLSEGVGVCTVWVAGSFKTLEFPVGVGVCTVWVAGSCKTLEFPVGIGVCTVWVTGSLKNSAEDRFSAEGGVVKTGTAAGICPGIEEMGFSQ